MDKKIDLNGHVWNYPWKGNSGHLGLYALKQKCVIDTFYWQIYKNFKEE